MRRRARTAATTDRGWWTSRGRTTATARVVWTCRGWEPLGSPGGVDYPVLLLPAAGRRLRPAMPLDEAEDLTVAMLFAGLDRVAPGLSVTPADLAAGRRPALLPGLLPARARARAPIRPSFTNEFCYRSPCGSTQTIEQVIENLRAMVDPGPPIPVANPPLDSLVVGIENSARGGSAVGRDHPYPRRHRGAGSGGVDQRRSGSRVEWAIEDEVFLICGPTESMIGVDGMPGCAHTF